MAAICTHGRILQKQLNELRLDMMIIPRADNYFNRCKSNVKFLETSMLEIPVIAQAFPTGDSPYQQNPEDSKYLILATDYNSWIDNIEKLIADKNLRLEMGKKLESMSQRTTTLKACI